MVTIGDTLESSRAGAAIVSDKLYAAVGVHPYHPEQANDAGIARLRALAKEPGVVAIGEIGLDYFRHNTAPREAQQAAFLAQIRLAAELALPVVIHNRDANDDLLVILAPHRASLPAVVMHCFSGDAEFARRCLDLDCYISFAGNVTYPKAETLRDAARVTPLERVLIETDAPYLAPQARRGKRNEPAYLEHTAAGLATTLSIPVEALARATTDNAIRVFRP
jgi:TatD DNase family protein